MRITRIERITRKFEEIRAICFIRQIRIKDFEL